MNKLLGSYKNGNYFVQLYSDGTKVRYNNEDTMVPDTIESLDIKITNRCDMMCSMCHENSTPEGKHANLYLYSFIDKLHPYTELAIGGGNPLEHPDLVWFLKKCKELRLIPSMTINQHHFLKNYEFVKYLVEDQLIWGLGISLTSVIDDDFIEKVKKFPNAVIHTIAGLTPLDRYEKLSNKGLKVLILGYKQFRRGKELYSEKGDIIEKKIQDLANHLESIIKDKWFEVLSFDNLALEQLNVKSLMSGEMWDEFYMGDDGIGDDFDSATMYVDMVERVFAKNSCDPNRYPLKDTIEEMYNFLRKENDRRKKEAI